MGDFNFKLQQEIQARILSMTQEIHARTGGYSKHGNFDPCYLMMRRVLALVKSRGEEAVKFADDPSPTLSVACNGDWYHCPPQPKPKTIERDDCNNHLVAQEFES